MTPHLQRLRKLAEGATPGPWESRNSIHGNQYRYVQIGKDDMYSTAEMLPQDADYIAALSPEVVLAMLDCIDAGHKMANEFGGVLSFEAGVRAATGNTNYAIALQRVEEFDAAISRLSAMKEE